MQKGKFKYLHLDNSCLHFINNHQIYPQFIKTIQVARVIIITFIFNILSLSLMMPQINNSQINFPFPQENLLHQLANVGKPIVLVLLNGSALAINWEAENIPAIIEAWYHGQAAGDALTDVLFGDYNPSGRLPITLYRSVDQLPAFNNYSMNGRTYRYFNDEPLYPFGYGMSYTKFKYSNLKAPDRVNVGEKFNVSVEVQNTGKIKGDEVVQLYLKDLESSVPIPIRTLQGFKRISLLPSEKKRVEFMIEPRQLSLIDNANRRIIEPGKFEISIGGRQPGKIGKADISTTDILTKNIELVGEVFMVVE